MTRPYSLLTQAELSKQFILLKRYPIDTVSRFTATYLFFVLLFYAGNTIAPQALSSNLESLIVGYFLFTIASGAYSSLASNLTSEAEWGTLEQLYVSPFGFSRIAAVKILGLLLITLLLSGVVLFLMLLTTGEQLLLDWLTVVPLVLLTVGPIVGIGLFFGGLALLYKRISSAFSIVQFLFPVLIVAPVEEYPVLELFPLTTGHGMLLESMRIGTRFWQFEPLSIAILLAKAGVYIGLGYLSFHLFARRARKLGVMGHY